MESPRGSPRATPIVPGADRDGEREFGSERVPCSCRSAAFSRVILTEELRRKATGKVRLIEP